MKKAPEMLSQNNSKSTTMKQRITQAFMVIMFMTIGLTAQARENEREISLTVENSKAVVLTLSHIEAGTKISLWDANGKLLFEDKADEATYGKVFNLQQLKKGELMLEIEDRQTLQLVPITVSDNAAKMKESAQKTYVKPIVRTKEGEMKVYLRDGHGDYTMRMLDKFQDVVYRESVVAGKGGIKRYDVSKLPSGTYNIQFTADGRSFYHTITLN